MQTLVEGRKIDEDDKKDAILQVISDKYCRAILETTMDKPKSAMEISAESKIPISTVYRRLQTLHDNKLLGISGSISDDGKKYFLYRSKVKAIASSFKGGFVEIQIVPNPVLASQD
jgi:predicted transcriptional regulator